MRIARVNVWHDHFENEKGRLILGYRRPITTENFPVCFTVHIAKHSWRSWHSGILITKSRGNVLKIVPSQQIHRRVIK